MARSVGDKNYSPREERLVASNQALKAEINALKRRKTAELEARDARIRELRKKLNQR